MEEVNEKEGTQGEPAYLAERYSRQARRSLLALILCAVASGFSLLTMSIFSLNGLLFNIVLLLTLMCGIALLFLPLLAVGYYAQADFYKSLLDGKSRLIRWRHYSFFAVALFVIFALFGMLIPSLETLFLILSFASFVGAIFMTAGYFTYSSEKEMNERRTLLSSRFGNQESKAIEMISARLVIESVVVFFAIVLFVGIVRQNFLVGVACLVGAIATLYHLVWTYRRHAPELRELSWVNREIMFRPYLEEQRNESPRIRRIKRGINAVVMALNYLLWLSLLYEIKIQSLPVGCSGAWPLNSPFYFIALILLTGIVFFTTAGRKNRIVGSLIMSYISFLLAFLLYNMVGGCPCWNSAIITKTYLQATAIFILDTAAKAAMITGLLNQWARKQVEKMLAR